MPHQDTAVRAVPVRPVLRDPFPGGYLHLSAVVEPPRGRSPFPPRSSRREAALAELKRRAAALEALDEVRKATVYRARFIPPSPRPVTRARFDVSVLVETHTFEALEGLRATRACADLVGAFQGLPQPYIASARCIRMIADVEKGRRGLYLFNYFASDGTLTHDAAVDLWERLAGWYVTRTGLANSTLLEPVEEGRYIFINHARWDVSLATFIARQLTHPSFRPLIVNELRTHRTVSMPIFYARA